MSIPPAVIRRATLSATASARARGRDARPHDIALMLQERYDSRHLHDLSEWEEIARQAVAMVSTARDIMDVLPVSPQILY